MRIPAVLLPAIVVPAFMHALAQAQQPSESLGRVTGEVVAATGAAVADARIAVISVSDSTVGHTAATGVEGRFSITGIRPGVYSLRITRLGYAEHLIAELRLGSEQTAVDLGKVTLTPAAVAIEGVEVQGQRSEIAVAFDRTVYSTKDMAAASGGTATDILRSVPELEVDMNGRVSHHGTSVQIHINGRPAPVKGDALDQFLQQFPADRIDRVEVIPNPSARFDAEGSGGIVNIVLKQNASLGFSGSVGGNAGTLGNVGSHARVAYQEGPLTVFGGLWSGRWNNDRDEYDFRRNLITTPITVFERGGIVQDHGWSVGGDLSGELRLRESTVMWSTLGLNPRNWGSSGDVDYRMAAEDESSGEAYDQVQWVDKDFLNLELLLGAKQTFRGEGHELSAEVRRLAGEEGIDRRITKHWFAPTSAYSLLPPQLFVNDHEDSSDELILQADYIRPLGEKTRLEIGYKGYTRDAVQHAIQRVTDPDREEILYRSLDDRYRQSEDVQAGYLLLGRQLGKLRAQVGARLENSVLDLHTGSGDHVTDEYLNLFPSVNLSYTFAQGREARLMYSRRLERPGAGVLNPVDYQIDQYNRSHGNPYLEPKYTRNLTGDLSWSGQAGTLRLSPYFRETDFDWERVREVSRSGVSTLRWENVSSLRTYGTSLMGALQPARRLSGSLTVDAYRARQDVSNEASVFHTDEMRWSVRVNSQFKAASNLDVQAFYGLTSPRDLGQTRVSAITYHWVGLRHHVWNRKASLNLWVNDPLDLYRSEFTTRDAAHVQRGKNTHKFRAATIGFSYNFGKTPKSERKQRREEPSAPQEPQVEIR